MTHPEILENIKAAISDLEDRADIEEILNHCKVVLALRKGAAPDHNPAVREIFDYIKTCAEDMGVRTTSFAQDTLDVQRRAAAAIHDLMREHGPTNPLEARSLIKDMVRWEVESMREAGYQDFTARHLYERLKSPRTSVEQMFPGYIDAGLLRLIGGLTKRRVKDGPTSG